MTGFITFRATNDRTGEVEFEEQVVTELETIWAVEKGFHVLGEQYTLRVEFDPPVLAPPGPDGPD